MYIEAGCSLTSCCNEFMSADNRHNYYGNCTYTHTHTNTQRKTGFFRALALVFLVQAACAQLRCHSWRQDFARLVRLEDITHRLP